MEKRKLPIIAILLVLSIGNYARIEGTEHIRLIEFVSIFTIGILSGLLLHSLVTFFKNRS
jgi:hypothetical protein